MRSNKDGPPSVAFPNNICSAADRPLIVANIACLQGEQLGDTCASGEEHVQHCSIAQSIDPLALTSAAGLTGGQLRIIHSDEPAKVGHIGCAPCWRAWQGIAQMHTQE